jgi:quercetin dioxygenase-like cupin family protein
VELLMSRVFSLSEAKKTENPGIYDMYALVSKDLGATRLTAVLYEYKPNVKLTQLHIHENRESAYIVLEGEVRIHLNGEEHTLKPGMFAYLSPKDVHAVIGTGPKGVRMIEIWSPQDKDIIYLEEGKTKL